MSISVVSTSTSNTGSSGTASLAAPRPSGVINGDLMLAFVAQTTEKNKDTNISDHPDGWTFIKSTVDLTSTQNGARLNMYYRVVTGNEPASYTWVSKDVNGRIAIVIVAYRGSSGITGSVLSLQTDKSRTFATGSLTVGPNNWLVSAFVNAQSSTFTAAGTTRGSITTTNTTIAVADTNGTVGSGTYTRTATAADAQFVGVSGLISLLEAPIANQPPVVNAGSNQSMVVPGTVALSGSASDNDGTVANVQWTQTAGPAVSIVNSGTLNASVSLTSTGTYTFRLTAVDNSGASATSDATVTAYGAGQGGSATPPTAAATASNTLFYLIDASTSQARNGGTLSYKISPSTGLLAIASNQWLASPGLNQKTFSIIVSESGSAATSVATVVIPAQATAPTSTDGIDSGVETLVYKNGAWS